MVQEAGNEHQGHDAKQEAGRQQRVDLTVGEHVQSGHPRKKRNQQRQAKGCEEDASPEMRPPPRRSARSEPERAETQLQKHCNRDHATGEVIHDA